jgi:hypothetical protein
MTRHLDAIGLALLAGLAAAITGGGVAIVAAGLVKPWELTAVLGLGGVLVAAASERAVSTTPKNTLVHGAARPAAETEAKAAARGIAKAPDLHNRTFPE